MKGNYHIYPTTITNESRMMKETASICLLQLSNAVRIVGIRRAGLPSKERVDEHREIIRLHLMSSNFRGKLGRIIFYCECYFRYFLFLAGKRISSLNCHSLMMLPVAVLIKSIKSCRLIYDTHELETERTGLYGIEKKVSKMIERRLIRHCNSVITVGPEISNWYRQTYGINNVFTVRNIPSNSLKEVSANSLLREKFRIGDDSILFIYQGYFIPGRGIRILIEAFRQLSMLHHIVFMGEGTLQEDVENAGRIHSNIHFHPTVPYAQVLEYSSGCDIGVSLFENTCLSHYYVLPNKVFEYIKSHLPILVSDFPEMRNIVHTYDCGWATEPNVSTVIKTILAIDRNEVRLKKQNAIHAATQLHWKNEEPELLRAFTIE